MIYIICSTSRIRQVNQLLRWICICRVQIHSRKNVPDITDRTDDVDALKKEMCADGHRVAVQRTLPCVSEALKTETRGEVGA